MLSLANQLQGVDFIVAGLALVLVLVMSFTLHEFAHAFVAYKCGDDTPKFDRRLTLNPLNHMDFIGFFSCLLFGFGWAKPVRINPLKFRKYKKGLFLVSIAGVTVNLILAIIFSGLYVFISTLKITNYWAIFLYYFCLFAFSINICLFVFNLLPIYPLDGFNAISVNMKYDNKYFQFMTKYGSFVLIGVLLLLNPLLGYIMQAFEYPLLKFWSLIFI